MPDEILTLGHHEFIQRVQEIEIAPLDGTGLLLRLCASVEVHSTEPPGPGRHRRATRALFMYTRAQAGKLFEDSRLLQRPLSLMSEHEITELFQIHRWEIVGPSPF